MIRPLRKRARLIVKDCVLEVVGQLAFVCVECCHEEEQLRMRNYEVTLDGEGLRTGPMRSQNPIGARAQERGTADQSFEVRNDGPVTDLVWVVEPSR